MLDKPLKGGEDAGRCRGHCKGRWRDAGIPRGRWTLRERCKERWQLQRTPQRMPVAAEDIGRCRDAGNSQTILVATEDVAKNAG